MYTAKEARNLSEQSLELRNEKILTIVLKTDLIISINTAIKDAINSGRTRIYFKIECEKLEVIKEKYFYDYTNISPYLIVSSGICIYYKNLGYKVKITETLNYFMLQVSW